MKLTDEEHAHAGRRVRPGGAVGDRASDQGRGAISAPAISCRSRRPTSWPTPSRWAWPASNGWSAWRRCRADERRVRIPTITDPRGTDFAAAHRLKHAALDARPRAPRDRGVRGARRADDRYLHQLPDHHAAGARRARRLWRHRRGDLFEQRVRRALELRGRAVGAERRADRPHAALRLSPRRAPRARRWSSMSAGRRASSTTGARSAGSSGGWPATIGRCRCWSASSACPGSDEMKHFGAALASYGSVALFHMAGVTPEAQRLDDVIDPGRALRTHDVGEADIRAFARRLRASRRDGRPRGVLGAATEPRRDGAGRRPARRPARERYRCWSSPARRSSPTRIAWA